MLDLGINTGAIAYEVALEMLGQRRQPLMRAIEVEKQKQIPSKAFIRYCEIRLLALDELQDELRSDDLETIERVISPSGQMFRVI